MRPGRHPGATAAACLLGLLVAAPWSGEGRAAVCERAEVPTLIAGDLSVPARVWCVSPPLSGRKLRDRADGISAVACVSETLCVVASDETRFAQAVLLDRERHWIIPARFVYLADTEVTRNGNDRKTPPEFDIEAAAQLNGWVTLAGSHGVSRDGEPSAQRHRVFGFRLNESRLDAWPVLRDRDDDERKRADGVVPLEPADGEAEGGLVAALVDALEPEGDGPLRDSRERCLQDNGFNIEGLAYAGNRVLFGLRGPVVDGHGVVLSTDRKAFLAGRIVDARQHRLKFDGWSGIRAMLPLGSGLLVLTGRSQPGAAEDGPCAEVPQGQLVEPALYYWGGPERPDDLRLVARFSAKRHKPEAMALLGFDRDRKELELLIFFDDVPDGSPTSYRIPFAE